MGSIGVTTEFGESRAPATRQRILDAAAYVFSRKGYSATRLSDIGEVAGMKAGSFYYHFSSKDELIEQVLQLSIEENFRLARAAVAVLPTPSTAGDRLRAAIRGHADAALARRDYTTAAMRLIGQVPEAMRQRHFDTVQRPYGVYWNELFHDARGEGAIRPDLDLLLVRFLVLGAVNWAVEWPPMVRESTDLIADSLIALVFEGLQPRDEIPGPGVEL
jgi:AcrR family transcriptional regulator